MAEKLETPEEKPKFVMAFDDPKDPKVMHLEIPIARCAEKGEMGYAMLLGYMKIFTDNAVQIVIQKIMAEEASKKKIIVPSVH